MAQPGQYATILGQLGDFLQAQGAQQIEITDEGAFLAVCWQNAERRSQRYLTEAEVAELGPGSPGSGPLPTLLSGLGRQLDQAQIEVSRIFHEGDSFVISGVSHGRYVNRCYTQRELGNQSAVGQTYRALPSRLPTPPPAVRSPAIPGATQAGNLAATTAPVTPLRHRLGLQ
jgi:hypothetical protein